MGSRSVETPLDRSARRRVQIAFVLLFAFFSIGLYFVADLRKIRERIIADENHAVLREVTDPRQLDEAIKRHPSNRVLQMVARAAKASSETSVAAEKLSNEIEPSSISKNINLGTASRNDLEALRNDLKMAQANAATFLPRYLALLKAERDKVGQAVLSLNVEKEIASGFLNGIDQRHAEITAFTSRMMSARADYYRAYESYVAVLISEFGAYKVVNGEFIFSIKRAVDRYNVAARAMTTTAKSVAELEEERKKLDQSQQERWEEFVNGK